MTQTEEIASLKAKLARRDARIERLKTRLRTKIKYEKGYLQATSATPQLRLSIELKDNAVLEEE